MQRRTGIAFAELKYGLISKGKDYEKNDDCNAEPYAHGANDGSIWTTNPLSRQLRLITHRLALRHAGSKFLVNCLEDCLLIRTFAADEDNE